MKPDQLPPTGNDGELGDVPAIVFVPDKPKPAQKRELNKKSEQIEQAATALPTHGENSNSMI